MDWTVEGIVAVLGAISAFLGTVGIGGKYLIARIDAREAQSEGQRDEAVKRLEETLRTQIEQLQRQLGRAEAEIARMRDDHDAQLTIVRQERDRWLKEVWKLRTVLQQHDISIPDLGGPYPNE